MSGNETIYYPPGDAARQLDVSPSGLRRYANFYEEVYGPMQRDPQGRRMWTGEAVGRVAAAKAVLASGQAAGIKEALAGLESGETAAPEALTVTLPRDALGVLLAEMKSMREQLEGLQRLEAQVNALQRQLEAPTGKTGGDAELAEQRRLNQYLMGELERRSVLETTPRRRAWWRWWGRGED